MDDLDQRKKKTRKWTVVLVIGLFVGGGLLVPTADGPSVTSLPFRILCVVSVRTEYVPARVCRFSGVNHAYHSV